MIFLRASLLLLPYRSRAARDRGAGVMADGPPRLRAVAPTAEPGTVDARRLAILLAAVSPLETLPTGQINA